MFDKPAGAAQRFYVPQNLRCYERIESIEFIEKSHLYEQPSSAAYKPTENGSVVRLNYHDGRVFDENLNKEETLEYLSKLNENSLFDLDYSYRPIERFSLVDTIWRIKVCFTPNEDESVPEPYISEGDGCYPDCYKDLTDTLLRYDFPLPESEQE